VNPDASNEQAAGEEFGGMVFVHADRVTRFNGSKVQRFKGLDRRCR
jgi:hypothetical protein